MPSNSLHDEFHIKKGYLFGCSNLNQYDKMWDFNWRFKQSHSLFLKFVMCYLTPFMMNFMLRKDTCLVALILINMTKCGQCCSAFWCREYRKGGYYVNKPRGNEAKGFPT